MKKSILQILLLSTCLTASLSYSQDILWEKSYGGKHADYLMDVQPTADYGFILAGSSLSKKSGNKTEDNNGDLDYWIWKMDEKGDLNWQKNMGGSGSDFLQSIKLTVDGGYILGGNSSSNKGHSKIEDSKGLDDYWIVKLNAKGDQEWQKTIGGSGQEQLKSICQTKDGGYIIGGSSSSGKSGDKTEVGFGSLDFWIVKLDSKGTIEWQKTLGGRYVDDLRSLETTIDGGCIVGGYSNSPQSAVKTDSNKGVGDYWVLKLNAKGEIEWQKTLGGNKDDQLYVVHQTHDKGYILGGNSNSESSNNKTTSNSNGTDFWVIKLDESGEILWQQTYDFGKIDVLTSLVENDDHTFLIGGYAQGEINTSGKLGKQKAKSGTDDFIALKINEKGEELWSKTVGSDGQDILKKVIETRDGGYVMAGTSNPQEKPINYKTKSTGSSIKNAVSGLQADNEELKKLNDEINGEVNSAISGAKQTVTDEMDAARKKANDALGMGGDSRLKLSPGSSSGSSIGLPFGSAGKSGNNSAPEKKLPPSGDKITNYGSNDFWVVKLRDKNKPKKEKAPIEAFPNPTSQFTNVIITQDFEKGTASVYDLAGRQLQHFEINEKTIPIDLGRHPEGIYIVEIQTNKEKGSVKIIKSNNKN
jgi:hypothetical protein